ncbi:MAG: hypothetical protein AAGD05_11880 [Bacteroidota bacterium]
MRPDELPGTLLACRLHRCFVLLSLACLGNFPLRAQVDFGGIVELDSVVITASKAGFNVEDFIDLVRNDASFYQAFRNLRFLSYVFHNSIVFFDKDGQPKVHYESWAEQLSDGDCRSMKILEENITGKYYKSKRKPRYYTTRLYERLFYTKGTICESIRAQNQNGQKKKGMAKHVEELKKLLFRPGEKAKVPLIGKKTAIFEERMHRYYDYRISSAAYQDSIDCYVFTVALKPQYLKKKKGKTVIKFLETYFEKETLQVIARNYQLQHKTALFDFDVFMKIKLQKWGGLYLPAFIQYDGTWDVAFKKRETARFEMRIEEIRINSTAKQ